MHAEIPKRERKLQYQVNFAQAIKISRDHLRNRDKKRHINASGITLNQSDLREPIAAKQGSNYL